jgi:folate-dependent tRNA-U54 methylase TrmFO/GidA
MCHDLSSVPLTDDFGDLQLSVRLTMTLFATKVLAVLHLENHDFLGAILGHDLGLDDQMRLKTLPRVSVAGQLTGSEGYVEAIATGLLCAWLTAAQIKGQVLGPPPRTTALGGLFGHLRKVTKSYQPSNIVWAMLDYEPRKRMQGLGKRAPLQDEVAAQAFVERVDGNS